MGILKSAADIVYTIRFLKLLTTPIEETEAFKAGIIDSDGNRIKSFDKTTFDNRRAYEEHYTAFHRLVYNLKKYMAKVPGGNSVVARYGAALALIKEHGELSDKNLMKIHKHTGIDTLDVLSEQNQWYVLESGNLSEGLYRARGNMMTINCEDIIMKEDKIKVLDGAPVDDVLGIPVYEALHVRSNQKVLITAADIKK